MNVDFSITAKHYASKTKEQIRDVLMDPDAQAPDIFYHMVRGNKEQGNITVLETGTVGGEYIKTYGHYHIGNLNETYWIKYGHGVALLQKLVNDIVGEFKAIPFKEGDKIFMPSGWGHVIVNTGTSYLVTVDDTVVYFDEKKRNSSAGYADYEMVKKMRGFAYYVIDINGTPFLKKNERYARIAKTDFGGLLLV